MTIGSYTPKRGDSFLDRFHPPKFKGRLFVYWFASDRNLIIIHISKNLLPHILKVMKQVFPHVISISSWANWFCLLSLFFPRNFTKIHQAIRLEGLFFCPVIQGTYKKLFIRIPLIKQSIYIYIYMERYDVFFFVAQFWNHLQLP